MHNRNKSYGSRNNDDNKKHFRIPHKGSRNPESNLSNKTVTGPKYIDADIISNIFEEDDKNSTKNIEEITDDNFDKFSRNDDMIYSIS